MKTFRILRLLALMALAGVFVQACIPVVEPTLPYYTLTPYPTYTPPPTNTPLPTATPDFRYFTEEFTGDIPTWTHFINKGFELALTSQISDGRLHLEISERNLWAYWIYDPFTYDDVRIDLSTDNFGVNNNQVGVICRYSEQYGWYEINIANTGLFNLKFFDALNGRYMPMYDGGTRAIQTGRRANVYTVICKDNQIILYINDEYIYTLTDKVYNLNEGKIGFSVSSFRDLPVIVDINSVTVSKP